MKPSSALTLFVFVVLCITFGLGGSRTVRTPDPFEGVAYVPGPNDYKPDPEVMAELSTMLDTPVSEAR